MADAFKFSKKISSDAGELLIRAQIADAAGAGWNPVTFEKSRIDYVTGIGEGLSGIALKTGAKIAVKMPYDELERRIYLSDPREEPVLDLREVTGSVVREARVPAPAADFSAAATAPAPAGFPEKRPMVDKPLKIALFARQSGEQNFQMLIFLDTNVDWSGVTGDANGKNGSMTKMPLLYGAGPFGESEVLFDMPRAAFMELYNRAKMEGLDELDLRDWTRRRDPDKTKAPAKTRPEIG
jgi:hypothetical protein